jgi:hypothetical protein
MTNDTRPGSSRMYTNVVLTVIAGLLAVNAVTRSTGIFDPSQAQAQNAAVVPPEEGAGLISAAEQRKVMITELRAIQSRLDRLESAMNRTLSVRVVEMPEVRVKQEGTRPQP